LAKKGSTAIDYERSQKWKTILRRSDDTEHLRSKKDFDISPTLTVRHEQFDDFANGVYADSRVNE
jgi:hypothetical protein